jgi:hypothetical protein
MKPVASATNLKGRSTICTRTMRNRVGSPKEVKTNNGALAY